MQIEEHGMLRLDNNLKQGVTIAALYNENLALNHQAININKELRIALWKAYMECIALAKIIL